MDFQDFWDAYPRREAKKDALKAWSQLHPSDEVITQMLEALSWQTQQDSWVRDDGQYIPLPASWIRGERWTDERRVSKDRRGLERRTHCPHTPTCQSWTLCTQRILKERVAS